jgi:fructose-specific phosphotransferase system IIC component
MTSRPDGPSGSSGGGMSVTSIGLLLLSAAGATVVGLAAAWTFYGRFPPIRVSGSLALWFFAVAAAVLAVIVRRRIADGRIGQDRSQLSPVFVSRCAVFGKAAAWIGAIVGGLYAGVTVYVLIRHSELLAAQQDTPGVVTSLVAGGAMAAAGVWLERSCLIPPGDADPENGRGDVLLTP